MEVSESSLTRVNVTNIAILRGLAALSYQEALLQLCLETIDFHHECLKRGIDDGRHLFVFESRTDVLGCCGFHRYIWGPRDTCWASWFFVNPEFRKPGVAPIMFLSLLDECRRAGFKRLYAETPSSNERYSRIALHLPKAGFTLAATLSDYYGPGIDQLMFRYDL